MEKEPEIRDYRGEIGSEYWIRPASVPEISGSAFPDWLQRRGEGCLFLSGRTALDAILKDIRQEREAELAYLPAYCCDSMVEPFRRNGFRVLFYEVRPEGGKLSGKADTSVKCDVFFSLSYFGFREERLPEIQSAFKAGGTTVIEDVTHSLFCTGVVETDADYSFASIRKWFGLPDGGIAWKQNGPFGEITKGCPDFSRLRYDAMLEKGAYMEGKEGVDKTSFLQKLGECEEMLEENYAGYGMSELSRQLLVREDIGLLRKRRRENARFLCEELKSVKELDLVYPNPLLEDCPLFVPILVKQGYREELRRHLVGRNIYCPVHWPQPEIVAVTESVADVYRNIFSLVCDQRYTLVHMQKIVEEIKHFYNG